VSARGFWWLTISWIIMIVCHTIVQGTMADTTDLGVFFSMRIITFTEWLGIPLPWPNLDWFTSIWNLASGNFAFYYGNLQWLRFFIGLPMMGFLLWGFYTHILPTLITGVSALINFLTGIAGALNPFRFFAGGG